MSSALSEEEFQRMQTQLIDLRTTNYTLEDQSRKKDKELSELHSKVSTLEKDLQRCNKVIAKSKKAKEVEELYQENEGLQRQLHSQEEEYRLQNQTLMQELTQLVANNEELEKRLAASSPDTVSTSGEPPDGGGGGCGGVANTALQDQCRRLQAQNAALQKNYQLKQEEDASVIAQLKQNILDLENQCVKLSGKRTAPIGQGESELERSVEGESNTEQATEEYDEEKESPVAYVNFEKKHISTEQENDLRLQLDTEREENKMLKEQLSSAEEAHRTEVGSLKQEVEKMSEKFKKKQESLVQLQEEKEDIYSKLTDKVKEVEEVKEKEMSHLKEQCVRLHEELGTTNKNYETLKQQSSQQITELEDMLNNLRQQLDDANLEANEELQNTNMQLKQDIAALNTEISGLHTQITSLQDTCTKHEEVQAEQRRKCEGLQNELTEQTNMLKDVNKIADKRKSLLDELAIKYQSESDNHRETMKQTEAKHKEQVAQLETQVTELQDKLSEYKKVHEELQAVNTQLQSSEETKGWLERRLNETQDSLNNTKVEYESKLDTTQTEHDEALAQIQAEHKNELEDLHNKTAELDEQIVQRDETITKLEQKVNDGVEERKLHEKKGLTMVKDLKRQLQLERKTVEKLQSKLQEILSDKNRHSMDDILALGEHEQSRADSGSVSSWSASGISKDNITSQHSVDTTDALSASQHSGLSTLLEQENNDLVDRLAQLKDQNWMLEEKVSHLESSNACMADDLLKKTAIIEHYVLEGRADAQKAIQGGEGLSLKRVVDFVKDRGDESLKDINRKLQRMVEETLTKNMHLQQDLETLSQEVVRLSKLQGLGTPTDLVNKTMEADITARDQT